jgi:lactoylglutathione lyase
MVKLGYTILYVNDVEKSMAFYEKAFGLARKFNMQNMYGELLTGETTLSFASIELAKTNLKDGFIQSDIAHKPFAIEIAFTTENVQEVYDNAIAAGAVPESPPQWKPHGQTVSYVRDLDGFLVEICTPMG